MQEAYSRGFERNKLNYPVSSTLPPQNSKDPFDIRSNSILNQQEYDYVLPKAQKNKSIFNVNTSNYGNPRTMMQQRGHQVRSSRDHEYIYEER